MLIGVDLDDVLADTLSAILLFHNNTFGTTLVRSDFTSYNYENTWGGTKEEAIEKFFRFTKTPYFQNILPKSGAVKGIRSLKKNHTLVIITSRDKEIVDDTKTWVNKHFPNMFNELFVANHPHWARSGKTQTKREICDQLGVDVLIEDNLDYATESVTEQRHVFILDAPWNQARLPKNIHRVRSWDELVTHQLWGK